MRWFRVLVVMTIIASLCIGLGFTPQPTLAAEVEVTTCTQAGLEQAINDAATTDLLTPGLVTFNCPNPTITFSSPIPIEGQLQNTAVIIDGSNDGNPIIFDGNDATRFFNVGDGGYLTIQHLTLQNGYTPSIGGAIYVISGHVTITQSNFISNSAGWGGAIENLEEGGTVTINQSSFTSNTAEVVGGVIENYGTVTINQSSFTSNSAGEDGGAIENFGDLTIRRSSFVNNHSLEGRGGAIDAWDGPTTIIAATLTGNTAGEDAIGRSGSSIYIGSNLDPVRIVESTIVQPENTTPALYIYNTDTLTLQGVILGGDGPHCEFIANGDLTDTHTLSNDSSCNLQGTGSSQNVANLLLGPLTTATIDGIDQSYYPLLDGSPAINAGPTTCDTDIIEGPDTDQLGNPRPIGPACDIGAIEGLILYPATLCANRWNGQLRMTDDCSRSETTITLPFDAPLELCVNTWNGATRLGPNCSRSEYPISVIGDNTVSACINNWTGTLRITHRCTRSETQHWL